MNIQLDFDRTIGRMTDSLGLEDVVEKAFSESLSGEDILPNFEIVISKLI